MIELRSVTLGYGYRTVITDINFSLAPSCTYVIEGPNGSGKTTLLKSLTGFIRPHSGSISWTLPLGQIGWLTHEASIYMEWSASSLFAWYRNMFFPEKALVQLEWKRDPVLRKFTHEPLRTYSRGMRQRFFLHILDVWAPRVVCLDEPLTGLDENARRWCIQLLHQWSQRGQTLVITTHHPLDDLAHYRVILKQGHLNVLPAKNVESP